MLPSGQQKRPFAFSQTCRRGQHRPCTQMLPSGQQTRPAAALVQTCSRGQHVPSMQSESGGQQTSVPSGATQICLSRQQRPLTHFDPGGQHVVRPVSGSVQHVDSSGQQTPSAAPQQRVPSGQQLSPHSRSDGHSRHCPVAGSQNVPAGQHVSPQMRVSGQQIVRGGAPGIEITMHFVPWGQHMPWPSGPTQHVSSRPQHRPIVGSQHFVSGGQQSLPQIAVSGHFWQPFGPQIVPGGQHTGAPAAFVQTRDAGQHVR
jgi:hypothetical protein